MTNLNFFTFTLHLHNARLVVVVGKSEKKKKGERERGKGKDVGELVWQNKNKRSRRRRNGDCKDSGEKHVREWREEKSRECEENKSKSESSGGFLYRSQPLRPPQPPRPSLHLSCLASRSGMFPLLLFLFYKFIYSLFISFHKCLFQNQIFMYVSPKPQIILRFIHSSALCNLQSATCNP